MDDEKKAEQATRSQVSHNARNRVEDQRVTGKVNFWDLIKGHREEGRERAAKQTNADTQTKALIHMLTNPKWLSYSSMLTAIEGVPHRLTQQTDESRIETYFTAVEWAESYASMVFEEDLGLFLHIHYRCFISRAPALTRTNAFRLRLIATV